MSHAPDGHYPISVRQTPDGEFITTNVSFDDFKNMQVQQRYGAKRTLPAPPYALNNALLRELIVVSLEERAGWRNPQSGDLKLRLKRAQKRITGEQREQLQRQLDIMCGEHAMLRYWKRGNAKRLRDLEIQIESVDTQLRKINDVPGMIASVVYLYYRLGYDSVEVAKELELKPNHIRQTLYRLRKIWERRLAKKFPIGS